MFSDTRLNWILHDIPQCIHEGHAHPTSQKAECKSGRMATFVDDSTNSIKAKDLTIIKEQAQHTMTKTEEYLKNNKLVLNLPKTQMMVNCHPLGRSIEAKTQVQGAEIIPQTHMKILGVIISADRTWTRHINYLVSSVQPRLIAIRQLAKYGSKKTIAKLGQSLIVSKRHMLYKHAVGQPSKISSSPYVPKYQLKLLSQSL